MCCARLEDEPGKQKRFSAVMVVAVLGQGERGCEEDRVTCSEVVLK